MLSNLFRITWKKKIDDIICYMHMSLLSLQQGNLRNFNEIFKKDMFYGNIKSHKKAAFNTLSLSLEITFLENGWLWGGGGGEGGWAGDVKLNYTQAFLGLTFQKWIIGRPGPHFSLSLKNKKTSLWQNLCYIIFSQKKISWDMKLSRTKI